MSKPNKPLAILSAVFFIAAIIYMFAAVTDSFNLYPPMMVPGSQTLTLSSGSYIIYQETQGPLGEFEDGSDVGDEEPEGLNCKIVKLSDGTEIPRAFNGRRGGIGTFDDNDVRRQGLGIWEFKVKQPGEYELKAWFSEPEKKRPYVLAVGPQSNAVILPRAGLALLAFLFAVYAGGWSLLRKKRFEEQTQKPSSKNSGISGA